MSDTQLSTPISYAKQAIVLIALERHEGQWLSLQAIEQETGLSAQDVRNVCGFIHGLGLVEEGVRDDSPCIRDRYAHIKPAAPSGFTSPTKAP
jgi:hypothetical protein